jgi:hypothetical protein
LGGGAGHADAVEDYRYAGFNGQSEALTLDDEFEKSKVKT